MCPDTRSARPRISAPQMQFAGLARVSRLRLASIREPDRSSSGVVSGQFGGEIEVAVVHKT